MNYALLLGLGIAVIYFITRNKKVNPAQPQTGFSGWSTGTLSPGGMQYPPLPMITPPAKPPQLAIMPMPEPVFVDPQTLCATADCFTPPPVAFLGPPVTVNPGGK